MTDFDSFMLTVLVVTTPCCGLLLFVILFWSDDRLSKARLLFKKERGEDPVDKFNRELTGVAIAAILAGIWCILRGVP